MKKEYIIPAIEILCEEPADMIAASSLTIDFDIETGQTLSRSNIWEGENFEDIFE